MKIDMAPTIASRKKRFDHPPSATVSLVLPFETAPAVSLRTKSNALKVSNGMRTLQLAMTSTSALWATNVAEDRGVSTQKDPSPVRPSLALMMSTPQ